MSTILDNLRLLAQGEALLGRLTDEDYAAVGQSRIGSSIGAQVRHVLDHYSCLLAGIEEGVVDYDARTRDPRLELDRGRARATFTAHQAALARLDPDGPLFVQIHPGPHADLPGKTAGSSLHRELQFVLLHTVHHYAMIAVELRLRGLPCEPDLGVAPATLGHRRASA